MEKSKIRVRRFYFSSQTEAFSLLSPFDTTTLQPLKKLRIPGIFSLPRSPDSFIADHATTRFDIHQPPKLFNPRYGASARRMPGRKSN